MNSRYFAGILVILASVALSSCKTTEANYRAAYEKTMAARDSVDALDDTIYGKERRRGGTKTVETSAGNIEVNIRLVKVTDQGGGTSENLRRYNVVAGQFKQKFNAMSLRNRLADGGYPGAFVVETSEPYYYIIVGSYPTAEEAVKALEALKSSGEKSIRPPCPFILDATARRASSKAKL